MFRTYSMELAGRTLTAEIGRVAEQANGAVLLRTAKPLYWLPQLHLKSPETVSTSSL